MRGKLEPEAHATDGRSEPRRRLFLAASASQTDASCVVDVLNLSASGLLIRTEGRLSLEEPLVVVLPSVGEFRARIVWVAENLYGCSFDEALSQGEVSAAVLRAQPAQIATTGQPTVHPGPRSEDFGTRLKRLRAQSPYTMVEFAAAVGVTKPTLWKWETGQVRPREDALQKLAALLGLDPVELLYGVDDRGDSPGAADAPAASPARPTTLAEVIADSRDRIADCAGTDAAKVKVEIDWD